MHAYPKIPQDRRWLVVVSSIAIQLCIGSTYAWSVFTKPLITQFNWQLTQVSLTFSIAVLLLGASAACLGRFVDHKGPRKAGTIAAILYAIGIMGSGIAVQLGSLYLLYLFYGVLGGIGLGIGYLSPIASLAKWFPDKRGLATGTAIMGFGFGAFFNGPLMAYLIARVGIANTFFILGSIYFIVIFCAAQCLSFPPANWKSKNHKQTTDTIAGIKTSIKNEGLELSAKEAVKTRRFWFLWFMFFINMNCGIAILSLASPMAQEMVGMSAVAAATMVGFMGLFNGGGRIAWSYFSDYIGRANVFTLFFIIQLIAFLILPNVTQLIIFEVLIFTILSCYGGGSPSIAAYIGDIFGLKEFSSIHGYILTAYSTAGLIGPYFAAWIHELTGSYQATFIIFSGLIAIGLVLSIWIRFDIRRLVILK